MIDAAPSAAQFNGSSLALVAGIVAFLRRKQPIGGWLFYFFCQVLLGLTLTAATTHWKSYRPGAWVDAKLYFLYAVSNLSRVIVLAEIGVVSIFVVRTRERQWVCGLRYALIVYAFLTVLKLLVDSIWFPATAPMDMVALAFPSVWILYFELSKRVRAIFRDKARAQVAPL